MRSVFQALALRSVSHGDTIVFRDDQTSINYRDLQLRVQDLAAELQTGCGTVGILLPNGIDWVIATLAIWLCGRRQVPLPLFFSTDQLHHICRDAGVNELISNPICATQSGELQLPVRFVEAAHTTRTIQYHGGGSCVIYTSGTTAAPRGVVHGEKQLEFMLAALRDRLGISDLDRHLSVLPFSLLLEQICSIYLPLSVFAESVIAEQAGSAALTGKINPFVARLNDVKPTTLVLVPQLLSLWNEYLEGNNQQAPGSLRFVAVGGAPVSSRILQRAESFNIPIYEGYGLSECCSVVTLNRPGDNVPGSVGSPLPGIEISIEAGEVIVSSPSVMDSYLGAEPVPSRWPTGDLGFVDRRGKLFIYGRKDNVLCTANGRNISPEWVESRLPNDVRVQQAVVTCTEEHGLVLILILSAELHGATDSDHLSPLFQGLDHRFDDLPDYAHPSRVLVCAERTAQQQGLLRASNVPDRNACARFAAEQLSEATFDNDLIATGAKS